MNHTEKYLQESAKIIELIDYNSIEKTIDLLCEVKEKD